MFARLPCIRVRTAAAGTSNAAVHAGKCLLVWLLGERLTRVCIGVELYMVHDFSLSGQVAVLLVSFHKSDCMDT